VPNTLAYFQAVVVTKKKMFYSVVDQSFFNIDIKPSIEGSYNEKYLILISALHVDDMAMGHQLCIIKIYCKEIQIHYLGIVYYQKLGMNKNKQGLVDMEPD